MDEYKNDSLQLLPRALGSEMERPISVQSCGMGMAGSAVLVRPVTANVLVQRRSVYCVLLLP